MHRFLFVALAALALAPSAQAGALWTWGARVGTPQLASGSVGLLVGRLDAPPRPESAPPPQKMQIPKGVLLQLEPGIGGGKVGLGFVKGLPPVAAGGLKAFYLRTWGRPVWTERGRDYVGVEADATLFMSLRLGVMRSVTSGVHDTAVTAALGVGF